MKMILPGKGMEIEEIEEIEVAIKTIKSKHLTIIKTMIKQFLKENLIC